MVGDDAAELNQHVNDAVDVGGRAAAVAFQQCGHARALDLRARQRGVERRQLQRLVLDDLDRGAALPEQDHRPEGGIGGDAGDQLVGARPHDHFLHGEAFQPRFRERAADPLVHLLGGGFDFLAARRD